MAPRLLTADPVRLSRFVSIGRKPPGPHELDELRRQGFRAVLDLRQETEDSGPLTPEAEAAAAPSRGLRYARVPIAPSAADDTLLDRVDEALKQLPKPLLVHCASGRRAGMAALAHVAIEQGMSGASMLEIARHLDVLYGTPSQQRWFADCVDKRQVENAAANPLAGPAPERVKKLPETPFVIPAQAGINRSFSSLADRRPGPHSNFLTRSPAGDCLDPRAASMADAPTGSSHVDRFAERPYVPAIHAATGYASAHRVFGVMLAGAVLAAVLDRRLAFVPLLTLGFAGRRGVIASARRLAARIRAGREADAEITALSRQLRRLAKSA